jgi:hypothetical protein
MNNLPGFTRQVLSSFFLDSVMLVKLLIWVSCLEPCKNRNGKCLIQREMGLEWPKLSVNRVMQQKVELVKDFFHQTP